MKIVIVENPRPLTIEHYNDVANAPLSASLNSGYAMVVSRLAGWDAAYLDFSSGMDDDRTISAAILAENPHVVLIHWVYSWGNEDAVRRILGQLKQEGGMVAGAFGLFPTLSRQKLLDYAPELDFILAGEFEKTLEEMLQGMGRTGRLASFPGLAARDGKFTPRELIHDISSLPVPDDLGVNRLCPAINVAASRGCFGDCGFCFINTYYGCGKRRIRSIASLESEIEARMASKNVRQVYFVDPTFIGCGPGEKERATAICGVMKNAGVSFGFETRVDTIDEGLVGILEKSGAASVFLGIESGCDDVLKRMNKRISREDTARAVGLLQQSGIRLNAGFIMFEPDSTMEDLGKNYEFLEGLGLLSDHSVTMNLLYQGQIVLYGSRAWHRFEKEGRLRKDERLPFEAVPVFRNGDVEQVWGAMKRVATEYSVRTGRLPEDGWKDVDCREDMDGAGINDLLKNAFCSFFDAAASGKSGKIMALQKKFLERLTFLIDVN